MKGRKILSAIIAGAMVLGTMSFPVFAENTDNSLIEVSDSDTLKAAVNSIAENGTIKFTNEITVTKDGGNDPGVITFTKNCTVDLNGQTLNTGELVWFAGSEAVKFTSSAGNGTIKFGNITDSVFRPNENGSFSIENITFTQTENAEVCYLFNMSGENSSINLKNCVLDNINTASNGGVICGNNSVNTKASIENCQITNINGVAVFGGQVTVKDSEISATTPFKIARDNHYAVLSGKTTITGDNNKYNGNKIYAIGEDVTVDSRIPTTVPAATIGTTPYATLADALAAAQEGDTITLLANAEPTLAVGATVTKATTIDLNGKTLTINSYNLHFGEMTFKNGTINVGAINASKDDGVFWQWDPDPLTFDNVTLNANEVTSTYLISENNGSDINIINGSVINVNPQTQQKLIVFCFNGGGRLLVDDSKINISNVDGKGILYGDITIKGDSEVNIATTKEGIQLTQDTHSLKIEENAVVTVANPTDTEKTRNAIQLAAGSAYSKADTARVNASIYRAPAADGSNLADEVKLTFEPTDKQEVYNIYVETKDAEQTINRLSAVQVKFELDNPKMSYTLAPATDLGVTLTNDLDDEKAYVFNFNGETAADATGVKLLIGTVTFGGYGNFNFTVDKKFNNKIKTAQTTDNIVEEYVPKPDPANEKQGTFDIASSAITGEEVVEAKRDVKVVIDFNNDITAGNDADYNDMTVTLTGSNGEEWIGYVGSAPANDDLDDKVLYFENTAEKAEMTFNVTAGYRYTVVVKGEGYRTARYSTNVDASDVVLTFWNNALEYADRTERFDYIEEGVERSKKSVTFLAGDIAQDNIIDKYDLAAVVSYFGFDNLKTTNPNYVKYDLNRDGKIDADDISYVLVSWDK